MDNIYLWTGTGWGKTTSALGVALRAIGHNKKVIIIQFMKGRKFIGEYRVREKLKPYYSIYQFGREGWVNLKNPSKEDKKKAQQGFKFIDNAVKKKPFLLILDEINLACAIGLLDTDKVIKKIKRIPKSITVYLTGRYAPKKLIGFANYATEVRGLKRPPVTGTAKIGIDY
ncbi:MAG TPA: cob(I)yrinic acid a,c-diamide adenosyltransferase [Candidatus Nanoarchaeia archaeon]|nr:cob(I)yrinic acid a,c-diamide adenosyltransferase [Candidatus Nanoarchaeia archaeon]